MSFTARPFSAPPTAGYTERAREISDREDWALSFCSLLALLAGQWALLLPIPQVSTIDIFVAIVPWAIAIVRHQRTALNAILINWPLLVLPLFTILSTLWSDDPSVTEKSSIEFLLTVVMGIIAGSCVKPKTLLSAFLTASAIIVALSALQNISEGVDYGLFGSKNYYALAVALMAPIGWAVMIDQEQPRIFRLLGIAAIVVVPPLLLQAESVGALVCTVITVGFMFMVQLLYRFTPSVRLTALIAFAFFVLVLVVVWNMVGDSSVLLNSLGKDETLTGRTTLWSSAQTAIAGAPLLGGGYQAFWRVGNWAAEELWALNYIPSKSGFHFHDTYLQVTVDIGFIGLSIFVLTLFALVVRVAQTVVFSPFTPVRLFSIYIVVLLLLRSPIEVDLFWQFQLPTIVFCLAWVYLAPPRRNQSGLRHRAPAPMPVAAE